MTRELTSYHYDLPKSIRNCRLSSTDISGCMNWCYSKPATNSANEYFINAINLSSNRIIIQNNGNQVCLIWIVQFNDNLDSDDVECTYLGTRPIRMTCMMFNQSMFGCQIKSHISIVIYWCWWLFYIRFHIQWQSKIKHFEIDLCTLFLSEIKCSKLLYWNWDGFNYNLLMGRCERSRA